jgi:hypothetical protein
MKYLCIEYANPSNHNDSIIVDYRLQQHSVVPLWIERVLSAQQQYQIDNPNRFYGFGSRSEQIADALSRINQCVDIINSHAEIINRHLSDIYDQDTLNYLHHIFEVYHGLLDQQHHEFWQGAPVNVKQALAELNLSVHRCEDVGRGAQPRHVVTYYGLPKTEILPTDSYNLFTLDWEPGTVFLNYVEIGKTIENLAHDNDRYIAPGAFQPFMHYSADFVVRFFGQTDRQAKEKHATIKQYYHDHKDFFGPWQDCYASGNIPLANIVNINNMYEIEQRQFVKSVTFK